MQAVWLSRGVAGWSGGVRVAAVCAAWLGLGMSLQAQTVVLPSGVVVQNAAGAEGNDNSVRQDGTGRIGDVQGGQMRNDASRNQAQTQNNNNERAVLQAARPPQPPSEFQKMVQATTGQPLPIFGAELFSGTPSTFAPLGQVPVPADYPLGPGDEVNLHIWGANTLSNTVVVDRNGSLSLPTVGTVRVAGMTITELQPYLKGLYEKLYKDVNLSATLGQLRSIQVFVVGYAVQPGSFSVGSLSTLVDALFACGGPLPNGSLRDIQVIRGGQTAVHFDLYDFLLHGDKSKSVTLQPGDTIFIPPVGAQVAVAGSVKAPAIYELRQETTVQQVLELAGGESNVASGAEVRLERIQDHAARSVEQVKLADATPTRVQNGDILTVSAVLDRFRNGVTLAGNVANPGRFPWHPGMRVSELIPNRESLITRNYFARYNLLGQTQALVTSATVTAAGGLAVVPTTHGGAPNAPNAVGATSGTDTAHSNTVASALTDNGVGFAPENGVVLSAPDIDWSYAAIERQGSSDLQTTLISFNLGKLVLDGDQSQNLELQAGDVVHIFSKADIPVPVSQRTRVVQLAGEIVSAGWYTVLPGETLKHLIARAGGFTPDAYLFGSQFSRESTRRLQEQQLQRIADDLEGQIASKAQNTTPSSSTLVNQESQESLEYARGMVARLRRAVPNGRIALSLRPDSTGLDSLPDLALEDGDRFVVPHVPDNVSVEGQVYNSSAFVYRQGRRVKDYLKEAGGPNRDADRSRVFVLRADGSTVSNQYTNVQKVAVFAGDTVIVPPMLDRHTFFRTMVDVSSLLTGLGVPLATLYLLAKQ